MFRKRLIKKLSIPETIPENNMILLSVPKKYKNKDITIIKIFPIILMLMGLFTMILPILIVRNKN